MFPLPVPGVARPIRGGAESIVNVHELLEKEVLVSLTKAYMAYNTLDLMVVLYSICRKNIQQNLSD